jgi:lysyl-tRNA synthetase class 2
MNKQDSADIRLHRPAVALRGEEPRADEQLPEPDRPASAHGVGRRNQRNLVPNAAWLFSLLIGLSDVISVILPEWREKLRSMHAAVVPGTLTAVASTALVITGLLLLMLSHALRRRKRRAWQASIVLLVFNIVIHLVRGMHIPLACVSLVAVGALLYFSDHF